MSGPGLTQRSRFAAVQKQSHTGAELRAGSTVAGLLFNSLLVESPMSNAAEIC